MSSSLSTHGPNTRYGSIDPSLFITNRARLADKLLPNALVVIHANDIMPINGDDQMPFRQHSDLFYLSGIDQEKTILLLYPDAKEARHKAILFLQETNPTIAVWEGAKYTHAQAQEASGIDTIYPLSAFQDIFSQLMHQADHLYLPTNEHNRAKVEVIGSNERFITWCKQRYPLHQYQRLAPLMATLRMVKSPIEISVLRKACQIIDNALQEVLPRIKAGIKEYEIEAWIKASITAQGSDGFAFSPIVASGRNTCVLHYTANNRVCQAGDLLLLDIGAIYANYRSDVTRVIPVSGRFTKRQKEVYEAVHMIMEQAKELLVVGSNLHDYHKAIVPFVEEKLLALGLLKQEEIKNQDPNHPCYKKYFMHGMSHHLGLGTHDFADHDAPFSAGMVLTVEPGIYIPEENIGIRLENDVVIKNKGLEDLTATIPLLPSAIEKAMQSS